MGSVSKFAVASGTAFINFSPTFTDIGKYTFKIELTDFNVDPLERIYQINVYVINVD